MQVQEESGLKQRVKQHLSPVSADVFTSKIDKAVVLGQLDDSAWFA